MASSNVLVIGKSGTGKSRSMINLDPTETFLINVIGKNLPFQNWKNKYPLLTKEKPIGNMIVSDDSARIIKTIRYINTERKEIKVGVIDDFSYVLTAEFMARGKEKSYEKFTDIATNAWNIIRECSWCRDDLVWIFLAHSDTNDAGEVTIKTIGKLLSEKISIEGMFTIVLNTSVTRLNDKAEYKFETQSNGRTVAKSPEGMFETFEIPNDLKLVVDSINKYNNGGQ